MTIKDLLLLITIFFVGICHGCACVVGAARGGMEGIRRDIAAAATMTAPGTPDTYIWQELPGQPPEGKGYYYED